MPSGNGRTVGYAAGMLPSGSKPIWQRENHCRICPIVYSRTMNLTVIAAAQEVVRRLKGTWHGSYGKARCPAHQDSSPSLSITPGRSAVLFHCFAGCSQAEIMAALNKHGGYVRPTERDTAPAIRRDLAPLARELWEALLQTFGTAERHRTFFGIRPHWRNAH